MIWMTLSHGFRGLELWDRGMNAYVQENFICRITYAHGWHFYEQTIVEVIPSGHAQTGAETMADEAGTVRLDFVNEKGDQTENE